MNLLVPKCCAARVYILLEDIQLAQGEHSFNNLCPQCRTGEGIVIDLAGGSDRENRNIGNLRAFADKTGFLPRILSTPEERADYIIHHPQQHCSTAFLGSLQLLLLGARTYWG